MDLRRNVLPKWHSIIFTHLIFTALQSSLFIQFFLHHFSLLVPFCSIFALLFLKLKRQFIETFCLFFTTFGFILLFVAVPSHVEPIPRTS